MTNEKLLELFENTARGQSYKLSENTIGQYIYYIKSLLEYLDNKSILEITNDDIISYTLDLTCSDSYLNSNISAFKSLYEILLYHPKTKNLIKSNPTIGVKGAKKVENKKEQIFLNSIQQSTMIKYAKNDRDRAILTLYFQSGLRVHELVALTLNQYHNRTSDNRIDLTVTKGSKGGSIWLSERTVSAIDKYLLSRKECEYDNLFISDQKSPMERRSLSRTIKNIAKRTGIFTDDDIKKISNHTCRRGFATVMLNEKKQPIHTVAKALRHSNLSSVQRYAQTDDDTVRDAMCM